jgi:hypothetical protein
MPSICLNMIIKNEAPVIERCLASVKPWIDRWYLWTRAQLLGCRTDANTHYRHSREGGNPPLRTTKLLPSQSSRLDPRLRGDDEKVF